MSSSYTTFAQLLLMTSATFVGNFGKIRSPYGTDTMAKKPQKERVQFEAESVQVEAWKDEAKLSKVSLSLFIRKACDRYAAFKKAKREAPPTK